MIAVASPRENVASSLSQRVQADELDPHVAVTVTDASSAPPSSRSQRAPVIAERYRLDRVIAEGGMGIVFEGWHLILNQPVAVKIVRREYLHDAEAIQSFIDEAQALAELRGPSVAQVLDAGLQDGMPFIVMELLRGRDLRVVAHESGPMPVEKAVQLVRQAGLAAAEAHARGIVHCDLKPENLFLAKGPHGSEQIKVIDFGICTRTGGGAAQDDSLSDKGSPEYMAPEQLETGRTVDERADVWALGVVLYELVTGVRPFLGDVDEVKGAVLFKTPTPMRELGFDVPEGFQRLVDTCLQKSPEARYANASKLCEALLRYEGTLRPAAKLASRTRPKSSTEKSPAKKRPAEKSPKKSPEKKGVPWHLSAAALGGTLLLTAAGWWLAGHPGALRHQRGMNDQSSATPDEAASKLVQPSRSQVLDGSELPLNDARALEGLDNPSSPSPSAQAEARKSERRAESEKRRKVRGAAPPKGAQPAVMAFPDVASGELPSSKYESSDPLAGPFEGPGTTPEKAKEEGATDDAGQAPSRDLERSSHDKR